MEPTNPSTEMSEVQAGQPVADQPKAEEHRIPKERLDQEIAKRKALEDLAAKLQQENAALKNVSSSASSSQPADDLSRLREDVAAIKQAAYRAELKSALQLQNEDQVKIVHDLMKSNPDLKPNEALLIASTRNAEAFGGKDSRTFQPGLHGSLSARGGGMPQVETLSERATKVAKMSDPISRAREEQRLHGKELARLIGLPRTD